jgi:hypothetical protein
MGEGLPIPRLVGKRSEGQSVLNPGLLLIRERDLVARQCLNSYDACIRGCHSCYTTVDDSGNRYLKEIGSWAYSLPKKPVNEAYPPRGRSV